MTNGDGAFMAASFTHIIQCDSILFWGLGLPQGWFTPVVATDTASRWSISKVRPDRVTYGSQTVNVWVVSGDVFFNS
jgi:hypothetical protein